MRENAAVLMFIFVGAQLGYLKGGHPVSDTLFYLTLLIGSFMHMSALDHRRSLERALRELQAALNRADSASTVAQKAGE